MTGAGESRASTVAERRRLVAKPKKSTARTKQAAGRKRPARRKPAAGRRPSAQLRTTYPSVSYACDTFNLYPTAPAGLVEIVEEIPELSAAMPRGRVTITVVPEGEGEE